LTVVDVMLHQLLGELQCSHVYRQRSRADCNLLEKLLVASVTGAFCSMETLRRRTDGSRRLRRSARHYPDGNRYNRHS